MLDYTFYRQNRVNKTEQWHQSDREENYQSENVFGPNLYTPDSFDYKFNSHGFRCDEFDAPSELPIVFLGCSFTEGEGLPVDKTWAYVLLEHIRNKTKKKIPFWNLAVSGCGIDMNAGVLANYIDQLRPRFIFYLRPPWMRRTIFVEEKHIQNWVPGFSSPHPNAFSIPKHFTETLIHEHFAIQQADRSLTIIDLLAEKYNTRVYHFAWQLGISENAIQPSIDRLKNFYPVSVPWLPNADVARDSLHPGPATHRMVANRLWEFDIKHLF